MAKRIAKGVEWYAKAMEMREEWDGKGNIKGNKMASKA